MQLFFTRQKTKSKTKAKKTKQTKSDINYECEYCKSTFQDFFRTFNLVKEEMYIRCPKCDKTLTLSKFKWNRRKILLEDEWALAGVRKLDGDSKDAMMIKEDDLIPEKKIKKYSCGLCEEEFDQPVHVKWHRRKIHSEKPKVEETKPVEKTEEEKPEESELIDKDIPIKTYPEEETEEGLKLGDEKPNKKSDNDKYNDLI